MSSAVRWGGHIGAMNTMDALQQTGDHFLAGRGIEMGAGLRPMQHPRIVNLTIVDKRDTVAFEAYFGSSAPYPLASPDDLADLARDGIDFIAAHQVVEHLANPIGTLSQWVAALSPGGNLFLSVPSARNSIECRRQVTPLSHLLDDYFIGTGSEDSYESKQHIFSFICGITAMNNDMRPWFASDVDLFVQTLLNEVKFNNEHDLHWHTYDQRTFTKMLEAAFWAAGYTGICRAELETDDALIVVMQKGPPRTDLPIIADYRARLVDALARCAPPPMTPLVVHAPRGWRALLARLAAQTRSTKKITG